MSQAFAKLANMVSTTTERLTPQQLAFVAAYVSTGNGKQSAIEAGYAPRSAEVAASRLLRIDKVSTAIQLRQQRRLVQSDFTVADWRRRVLEDWDAAREAGSWSAVAAIQRNLGQHVGALTDAGRSSTVEDAFWQQLGKHAANAVAGQLSERAGETVTVEIDEQVEEGAPG